MMLPLLFLLLDFARGQTSVAPTVVSMEVLAMKIPIWDTFPKEPSIDYDPAKNFSSFGGLNFAAGITPLPVYITNFFRVKDWCFFHPLHKFFLTPLGTHVGPTAGRR